MHPTQRKTTNKTGLFLTLILSMASPAMAGMDIDMTANVKNSTCKSGISNQGNIDLGVVGVGYFTGSTSAEDYQPGGKEFTVTVTDCAFQGTGDVLAQLHIDFRPLSGAMAAGSRQIFNNENVTGASNVGVVIFSIQDPAHMFNVLNSAGGSRSIYPVMSSAINNSSWKFSTRMQKINSSVAVTSGQVTSHVLIDINYE
ncbi:fimbrial protein [Escherichia coli]|nr:fimbrial protein [Escherichia coli]QML55226.1 fimbrial protein [Escherichia coli]WFW65521.1 fimbrial-like protein [Escherichia coli]